MSPRRRRRRRLWTRAQYARRAEWRYSYVSACMYERSRRGRTRGKRGGRAVAARLLLLLLLRLVVFELDCAQTGLTNFRYNNACAKESERGRERARSTFLAAQEFNLIPASCVHTLKCRIMKEIKVVYTHGRKDLGLLANTADQYRRLSSRFTLTFYLRTLHSHAVL